MKSKTTPFAPTKSNMHISSLSIRNFRNFRDAKFSFKSGINTIIGENGSGKTNLFYALRLLIDNSLPRYINLGTGDFNRSLKNWVGHWIIISVEFDNLDSSEESQALAMHTTGNMSTGQKGTYSVYFRPNYEIRKELYNFSQTKSKDLLGLQVILDKITIDSYETVYLSRGTGDFSDDETYREYVGDFEKIEFPNPDDKEEDIFGVRLPSEISVYNEVSCTFIKALRDVEADLRSYANNPLINLLRGKSKSVEIADQEEISKSVDGLNLQISSLDEVKKIKDALHQSIQEAVGTTYAPNVDIKSELPADMEKLFQSLKLWVGDPDDEDYKGKMWELSLGGANLIYLSLKLLEYEKTKTDKIANFLLIEEPEAHIHTHIQKTLFDNLQKNKTQVIISTHSTYISSVSKISSVNIVSRGNKHTSVFHPSKNLTPDEVTRLERYLDAVRSSLLFAKGVVLTEGDAEQILIPEMFKKVFGICLDEIGISLINIGSTGFENLAKLFHDDRVRKNCAILTDSDKSIIDLPKKEEEDSPEQKHCRASEKSGNERRTALTTFTAGNIYIKAFYSNHTLEVDYLLANREEVTSCLPKIYTSRPHIALAKAKLENPSVAVCGMEILRLAKAQGKGWFALLLADKVSYKTCIPLYILEALHFAAPNLKTTSILKSINYRIDSMISNNDDPLKQAAEKFRESFANSKPEENIESFKTTFKDDQLTKFLNQA